MSIGVQEVTAELLRARPLPMPEGETDKNSRGTAVVAGASATSAGAVTLSGLAALRAGAGKVVLAVPQMLSVAIAVDFPEAGVHPFPDTQQGDPLPGRAAELVSALVSRADVGLIGPGLMDEDKAHELTTRVLESTVGPSFVIDAMALTGLWHARTTVSRHRRRLVITPHAGEMARLSGLSKEEIVADPLRVARDAARHLDCIVVLKGATTVIALPDGAVYRHDGGIVGLATSGSGDVLAGLLAGLIARGTPPADAALWSVYVHAAAGRALSERIGPLGFLARELLTEIPGLLRSLSRRA